MADWSNLTLASYLNGRASAPAPAPVIGKLETLPFNDLSWEDFERLQWRMMRDVEGLRHAQLYGDRGQAQQGIDIVALAPDGTGVALQSKKYRRFGAPELRSAVRKFVSTERPFSVDRLIIGVASPVRTTASVQALAEMGKALHPVTVELWDAQELSYRLRGRPEIVIEYFGLPTAEAFCLPFKLDVAVVPPADAVAVREAIARTPEEATGARQLFDEAAATADPADALRLVEAGQSKLRNAGFGAHAARLNEQRARLLSDLGRANEAAREVLDELWAALDHGLTAMAQLAHNRLEELVRRAPKSQVVRDLGSTASQAINLYFNPLAHLRNIRTLRSGEKIDQVRLVLLAGETALANDDREWLSLAVSHFAELANITTIDRVLRTRLRILLAEATSEWSELLLDARRLQLGHDLLGLVTARFARDCAIQEKFEEADLSWDEASGAASLAQQWEAAATWILSRRGFRSRWNPFTSNELLPLQTALQEMGASPSLLPTATGAFEDALAALSDRRLRPAAISAQRALRDGITIGDWVGEERARRVLASVLVEAEEPLLAARHFARAGATKLIEALGASLPLEFINDLDDLNASNYWTVGTVYRLLATQADLLPDELVPRVIAYLVAELTAAEESSRPDLRAATTSRYNNAVKTLAGIAGRLDLISADCALSHFENQAPIEANRYRFHDEDEALAVSRIAIGHPSLAARALLHLVPLLGRSQGSRNEVTVEAVEKNMTLAIEPLTALSESGSAWALEMLSAGPGDVDISITAVFEAAFKRLSTPLTHDAGFYSVGTGAMRDALLIRHASPDAIENAVSELLARADDPHINSSDRGDYMIAAANLSPSLSEASRRSFYSVAIRLSTLPEPSDQDAFNEQFGHKLGGVRLSGMPKDARGQAVLLASALATNDAQRNEVRRLIYDLLGEDSDYWPTRALQRLGDFVRDDLAFLAIQGWAMRSFAAILWAEHGEPPRLGPRLAADRDVRVRRALARALAERPDRHAAVRSKLAADPAHSVRAAVMGSSVHE